MALEIRAVKSITDAQKYIDGLYPNSDRDFSYIYGYTSRHLGYFGKALSQKKDPTESVIRAVSWALALANKLDISIEDCLIERYPGVCPYCITTPCACRATNKRPKSGLALHKIPLELSYLAEGIKGREIVTFYDFALRLSSIYPKNAFNWDAAGPYFAISKMHEELSEVHEAYSRFASGVKPISAVKEEFADLFAWILGAWLLSGGSERLDDAFIRFYIHGCPVCGYHAKCKCALFGDRNSQLVDAVTIGKIKALFLQVVEEVGAKDAEVAELELALDKAAETQSEPVARSAVVATKEKVQAIEASMERGAKVTKDASVVIAAFYKILSTLGFV